MAVNFEWIILIGFVGRDAEMRYMPNGDAVTSFSLAVSHPYQDNGEWKSRTKWFKVSAWRDLAERCNLLKKGDRVMVGGRLVGNEQGNPRTWTDKNGAVRASFEVDLQQIVFLFKRETVEEEGAPVVDDPSSDIPF